MDFQPKGLFEKTASGFRMSRRALRSDLMRFKAFIEMRDEPTGAWRGMIEDGEVTEPEEMEEETEARCDEEEPEDAAEDEEYEDEDEEPEDEEDEDRDEEDEDAEEDPRPRRTRTRWSEEDPRPRRSPRRRWRPRRSRGGEAEAEEEGSRPHGAAPPPKTTASKAKKGAQAKAEPRGGSPWPAQSNRYLGGPSPSGLADVIDLILDKGLVIDIYVRVSLVGIELLTIDARIVVASVDTYLRFAEAVNRLDLKETDESESVPELMESAVSGGASSKTKGAIEGVKEKFSEAFGDDDEDEDEDEDEEEAERRPQRKRGRVSRRAAAKRRGARRAAEAHQGDDLMAVLRVRRGAGGRRSAGARRARGAGGAAADGSQRRPRRARQRRPRRAPRPARARTSRPTPACWPRWSTPAPRSRPMRFGMVLASEEAVRERAARAPRRDVLSGLLRELEGRVQLRSRPSTTRTC